MATTTLEKKKWYSVNEAAGRLGLTGGRIRQLLIANELRGEKLNERAWAISHTELAKFERHYRRHQVATA